MNEQRENGSGAPTQSVESKEFPNYWELDPNDVFTQAVHALENGDIPLFKELVPKVKEEGKLNNYFAIDGPTTKETLLHYAAYEGFKDAVDTLIEAGADITLKSGFGLTPVQTAARAHNNLDVLDKLIEESKPYNGLLSADERGNGLVHLISGNYDNVEKFLDLVLDKTKENVNQQNNDGNTPLHLAARYNDYKYVSALLANPDIDTSIVNNNGHTAYDVAIINCIGGRGRNPCISESKDLFKEYNENQIHDLPTYIPSEPENQQKPDLPSSKNNGKTIGISLATVSVIAIISALASLWRRRNRNTQRRNQKNLTRNNQAQRNNPANDDNGIIRMDVVMNDALQESRHSEENDIEMQVLEASMGRNDSQNEEPNPDSNLEDLNALTVIQSKADTNGRSKLSIDTAKTVVKTTEESKRKTQAFRMGA